MYVFRAKNESDTEHLACQFASYLEAGMVVTLDGGLGAGKTRFVQAIAKALGIKSLVNSPTFTLIREYDEGSLPIYHMDMYRIEGLAAENLGLDDYFFGKGVSFIEWGSRIKHLLPGEQLAIHIEVLEDQQRQFTWLPEGARYQALCERMNKNGLQR